MIGFIYALISSIGYSLNQIYNKKLLIKGLSNLESILISNFFLTINIFTLLILFGKIEIYKYSNLDFVLLIIGSILATIGLLFLFKSFKTLLISESLAIANIYPFITLILSAIFLNERITLFQFLLMILIFIGIITLIREKKGFKLSKYYFFPLITGIAWGYIGFLIFYLSQKNINLYSIIFLLEFGILIASLMAYRLFEKKEKKRKNISKYLPIIYIGFLSGLFTLIGTFFYGLSVNYIPSSIASSIASTQIMFSIISSYLLLNEKIRKEQIIGFVIIILSLILFNVI